MKYLSKSDFKVAQTCPTKLHFKKKKYKSKKEDNEYLSLLADGGFMIGKLAQLLYKDGIEISGKQDEAILQTEKLLEENESITLFEPAIYINNQLVRVDILVKTRNHFELIEVKSKSYNSEELALRKIANGKKKPKSYWLSSSFKPYLEDVAYQKQVLTEKYPTATINSYLLMPDKSKINTHENLIEWFVLDHKKGRAEVQFVGTNLDAEKLRESNFMGLECVDEEITQIQNDIAQKSKHYIHHIQNDLKIETAISSKCRDCEYKLDEENSGFKECWGKLENPKPHILDLGQLGNVNKKDNIIDELISLGKTSLSDVPIEYVLNNDKPFYNDRPFFQLVAKDEFLLLGFEEHLKSAGLEYPLHFIDFETCQMAVPFHKGMRPFQNVIFQWSCHQLYEDGTIKHFEWLNSEDAFPNIEFAKSLKDCIGNIGTVMTWSSYENTQLKAIQSTLEEMPNVDKELAEWLNQIIIVDKNATDNRILDMHELALKYYFHPIMGGRTSIKVVLPAVLEASKSNKIIKWLEQENLYLKDKNGKVSDPYKLLENKIFEDTFNYEVKVRNGADAMVAYREMMYGVSRSQTEIKNTYNKALRKYCKLDTLAMLIIWEHWQYMLSAKNKISDRESQIRLSGFTN